MSNDIELAWALWWLFAFADVDADVSTHAYAVFERQFGRRGYLAHVEGRESEIAQCGAECVRAVRARRERG